jgi:uncharacterized protein (DUF1501 family)
MLVPASDDAYARARKSTRIAAVDVLALDERVGLHPELGRLRGLYGEGKLALIEGVGYPEPNRSHFRSLDIWHAADPRGRGVEAGWIGRCVQRLPEPGPLAVVHLGARPPFALHAPRLAPLALTAGLLRATDPARARALDVPGEAAESPGSPEQTLAHVRALWHQAQDTTATLREALARKGMDARQPSYPDSAFAQDLRTAAALVHAELGVRVVSLELDGFDTHRDQRARHDRLMRGLDGGLAAFLADLATSAAGREALVLVFSEFGRRVQENASGGTDHGAAGLAAVLGTRVRGGLHGAPPALDALERGDLAFTTDFRRVYAACIRDVFDLAPEDVLGNGFAPLALV